MYLFVRLVFLNILLDKSEALEKNYEAAMINNNYYYKLAKSVESLQHAR